MFLVGLARAQPVYTNSDVSAMKARYVPRTVSRLPARYPSDFDSRPLDKAIYTPWMLPFQEWTEEYRAYFQRHSHDPRVGIGSHPDLHALYRHRRCPGRLGRFQPRLLYVQRRSGRCFGHVSTHLIIDKDGKVYQLLPFNRRCTGAYGVNHKAISIEMIASTEPDLLSRSQQVWSSFCVVRDLMKRYNIGPQGIIAHYEVGRASAWCRIIWIITTPIIPTATPPSIFAPTRADLYVLAAQLPAKVSSRMSEPFKPYVAERIEKMAEFTWTALILGALQAVFGVADAYLALSWA